MFAIVLEISILGRFAKINVFGLMIGFTENKESSLRKFNPE
jgi:hypothetical protein